MITQPLREAEEQEQHQAERGELDEERDRAQPGVRRSRGALLEPLDVGLRRR
jgi:hypothetical protein